MQALAKSVQKVVNECFDTYVALIMAEHGDNIEEESLRSLWEQASNGKSKAGPGKTDPKPSKGKTTSKSFCPYEFTKGKRAGEVCGAKSAEDSSHCGTHKKYENKAPKTSKVLPSTAKSTPKVSPAKQIPDNTLRPSKELGKGKLFHEGTGLVFDLDSKLLLGKASGKNVLPITKGDIEVCKQRGFKFPENALNSDDSDESEEEAPVAKKPAGKKVVESEEEEEDPKAKPVPKKAGPSKPDPKGKPEAKKPVSDSEDELPLPKKATKTVEAKKPVKPKDDSDSEDEVPVAKKVVPSKPAPKGKPVAESDSDLEDELDCEKTTKVVNKALGVKGNEDILSDSEAEEESD